MLFRYLTKTISCPSSASGGCVWSFLMLGFEMSGCGVIVSVESDINQRHVRMMKICWCSSLHSDHDWTLSKTRESALFVCVQYIYSRVCYSVLVYMVYKDTNVYNDMGTTTGEVVA